MTLQHKYIHGNSLVTCKVHRGRGQNFKIFMCRRYLVHLGFRFWHVSLVLPMGLWGQASRSQAWKSRHVLNYRALHRHGCCNDGLSLLIEINELCIAAILKVADALVRRVKCHKYNLQTIMENLPNLTLTINVYVRPIDGLEFYLCEAGWRSRKHLT